MNQLSYDMMEEWVMPGVDDFGRNITSFSSPYKFLTYEIRHHKLFEERTALLTDSYTLHNFPLGALSRSWVGSKIILYLD